MGPRPCARSPRWTRKLLETRFTALPVSGQARSTTRRFRRNISALLLSDRSPNQEAQGSMKTHTLEATVNRVTFVLPEDATGFCRVPAATHSRRAPFPAGARAEGHAGRQRRAGRRGLRRARVTASTWGRNGPGSRAVGYRGLWCTEATSRELTSSQGSPDCMTASQSHGATRAGGTRGASGGPQCLSLEPCSLWRGSPCAPVSLS